MNSENRRKKILQKLKNKEKSFTGTELSNIFNVSRQVIVQDIAILRAKGENIIATPRGYLIPSIENEKTLKTIVSKHDSILEIEEELNVIVDYGCEIIDVIVEHPIYGEIRGDLNISCRDDVKNFIEKLKENKAEPLASLTGGVHIHTIKAPSNQKFKNMKNKLNKNGYLID